MVNFPYEVVETSGEDALATWEKLKNAGRGTPVVLGSGIENYLPTPAQRAQLPTVQDILAVAATIKFPDDFLRFRRDELAAAMASLSEMNLPTGAADEEYEPPLGEWPTETGESTGLSVLYDYATGLRSRVQIALIPTDDPAAIPAYLHWGDWNDCPSPAYHVAALRAWRAQYGAELVGIDGDTMNLRVLRKPVTREEALDLARVQYAYCNDIIDQGVGSYRALAAELMAHNWWFFWWD
ncbi:DUF4253 domain-containing protein [Bradyrhizobium sp. 170]|uniref:DUF4253 domain-containing protein n=1 Tax=Bradyrhizobium sp. 170 TaxID=2782641 RepID=UPI001FFF265E|nr:DUF4253 domain-containing protein [Bradyrhizobium sp. 170]UPK00766.1 DUF4253 domain-containing protein [Bradyrhizobium sp. 170]